MADKFEIDHGITTKTPDNVVIGAGFLVRDYEDDMDDAELAKNILSATSGGIKLTIGPNVIDLELDGAAVAVERLSNVKQGEEAQMETNIVELTAEMMAKMIIGDIVDDPEKGFVTITTSPHIEESAYYKNLTWIGRKANGDRLSVTFGMALITGGFAGEFKNKEKTAYPVVIKCVAPINDEGKSYLTLPITIRMDKPSVG